MNQSEQVLFTFPGKIGDTFLSWPVAYHWARCHRRPIVVGLDRNLLAPLEPLFRAQSVVHDVILLDGIEHYRCGGQPYDFSFREEDYARWTRVYHCGFPFHPDRQITRFVQRFVLAPCSDEALAEEKSLVGSHPQVRSPLCVLHGRVATLAGNCPEYWRALAFALPLLRQRFARIVAVGSAEECFAAEALGIDVLDTHGSWIATVDLLQDAQLIFADASSVSHAAGCLKIPCIRVHDAPSGSYGGPPSVWANLGRSQLNLLPQDDWASVIVAHLETWCGRAGGEDSLIAR
jgi:hypothetical protein